MSWRDSFKFLTSTKQQTAFRSALIVQSGQNAIITPRNYESFSNEGYQKNVVARACVCLIAMSCSGIQWTLYNKGPKKREEIEDHPLLSLLRRPRPTLSGADLLEAIVSYKLISGNSYILATKGTNPKDPVDELWPMRPDEMTVIPGEFGVPIGYRYTRYINSVKEIVDYDADPLTGQSQILHLKSFHPTNNWYGLSPIESALYSIDAHNEGGKMYLSLLQNQARPSGALVAQGNLSTEQFERLKQQMHDEYQGSRNSGKPMLLEGGTEWKAYGFTPQDLSWIEGKNTSARDIARAFGVPPQMLGIPGDNTYSNYKEARMALYEETVLPLMNSIRSNLNNWLTPQYGDAIELDYDKDKIDALSPKREALWDRVEKANDLTINEKREAKGYEAIEGGDVILILSNLVPLQNINALLEDPEDADFEDPNDTDEEETDDESEEEEESEDTNPADSGTVVQAGRNNFHDVKIVNLSTRRERRAEVLRSAYLKKGMASKLRSQLKAQFRTEGSHLKSVLSQANRSSMVTLAKNEIQSSSKYMRSILESHLGKIAHTFTTRTLKGIKNSGLDFEYKDAARRQNIATTQWVKKRAQDAVDSIAETSAEKIESNIKTIFEDQMDTYPDFEPIGKMIDTVYEGFSDYRAALIARTETTIVANNAALGAAQATGLVLQKEWVASGDERTRGFGAEWGHAAADGQIVMLDEKFEVHDEFGEISEMDGPGDESAPVEQVVNCRCAPAFLTTLEGEE